jgi:hypothetical protein
VSKKAFDFKSIRSNLLELHRLILGAAKKQAEDDAGRTLPPAEWFQILIADPKFKWLGPLTTLLTDLDALSERTNIATRDLSILRHALEELFFIENDELTSFNHHYRQMFAASPEMMLLHGRVKESVALLPNETDPSSAAEIRRGWHETGAAHQAKRGTKH